MNIHSNVKDAMSSNQESFQEFPCDDHLWVVKYIDQFQQPHNDTRSASVTVMLQRLPDMSAKQLANLTAGESQGILGKRFEDPRPEFAFVKMLIGCIPAITIGFVFKNGVKVGVLPWSRHTISFEPGESDSTDVEAGQEVRKPPNWGEHAHRTLNPCEYFGIYDHKRDGVLFSKSRLVTISCRRGKDIEIFVIPRMTIFKGFYGQHSEIVKAVCPQPWSRQMAKVISLTEPLSGLKTEAVSNGEQWNIVLQERVGDEYAPVLAVLYFDEYARFCAESMYARAAQDRKGNPRAPWFSAAQIPLQALNERLDLRVKCLALKKRFFSNVEGERCEIRKYFVTEIFGSSWPSQYPLIGVGRTNDGSHAESPEPAEGAAPFGRNSTTKDGDSTTVVSQSHDANARSSTTVLKGTEWGWLGKGPQTTRLKKLSSKRYEGGKPSAEEDGTQVSAGAHTYSSDTLSKAETKSVVRVPNRRFDEIFELLCAFKKLGRITDVTEFAPRRPAQLWDRSGFMCWKFADDESLQKGWGVSPGWRAIYPYPNSRRRAYYRTALVLRLEVLGTTHYWIEIEHRESENFRSVLLSGVQGDEHAVIETVLEVIALNKGTWLQERINEAYRDDETIFARGYRHEYDSDRAGLDLVSVYKFLAKIWR